MYMMEKYFRDAYKTFNPYMPAIDKPHNELIYLAIGLAGECNELKYFTMVDDREETVKELGDVMWYLTIFYRLFNKDKPDSIVEELQHNNFELSFTSSVCLAESMVEKSPETRIVVIGTSRMIDPTFPIRRENIQFFVNTLDWLNLTEGLSSIRTKSIEFYPLKEIGAVERELVKYANMLFMPFLVIVAGIVMVLVRRRRANLLYPM